jgi:radical SAM protein with 4Fe4S-binding SPASM domain
MSQLLESLADKEGLEKSDAFYNFLRQKAWKKGIPLVGSFELTPRCTLRCRMCYVHLEQSQMYRDEIKTAQWLDLIDESCDAGMMYATLTGGECLMYPGFKEIYEHLQSKGVLVTVLTNGTLIDEKMADWISGKTPERIQISVYGSSPEGYEKVTGSAESFYKVDRAIDLVKGAGIPFNLAITLSKQMVPDFEATLRYCRSKEPGACNVTAYPFEARDETGRNYADYTLSLGELVEIAKIRLRADGKTSSPYSCEEELLKKSTKPGSKVSEGVKGVRCTAGRIRFSIGWDGRMTPCNAFDFSEAFPLEEGFSSAWETINRRSCEYSMPVECTSCNYKNACILCPAVHWLAMGEGRANPLICAEGKRMALEGIRKL